jgi:hypothetical protein
MMGERRVMQEALFYGFSLDRHIPDDHLLRKVDRFVDLSELRAYLGPLGTRLWLRLVRGDAACRAQGCVSDGRRASRPFFVRDVRRRNKGLRAKARYPIDTSLPWRPRAAWIRPRLS